MDEKWSRVIWAAAILIALVAFLPTVVALMGGIWRRGVTGLGLFLGHGILACAVLWVALQIGNSFADAFYPGRPATRIAPIELVGVDGAKADGPGSQVGQAMANYAAGIFQQVQSNARNIKKLRSLLDDSSFKRWVGAPSTYNAIVAISSKAPGLTALVAAEKKEDIKLELNGTDLGPIITFIRNFLESDGSLRIHLTNLDNDAWQAAYNTDTSGSETGVFQINGAKDAKQATAAFVWQYARRPTSKQQQPQLLDGLEWNEFSLLFGIYADFAKAVSDAYNARKDKKPCDINTFQPEHRLFTGFLNRALGPGDWRRRLSCAASQTSGEVGQAKKPNLLTAACRMAEVSYFMSVLAHLAEDNQTADFFFKTTEELEKQGGQDWLKDVLRPLDPSARRQDDADRSMVGLVTDKKVFAEEQPSGTRSMSGTQSIECYPTGAHTVLVAKSKGGVVAAAEALQTLLGQDSLVTIVLDLPAKVVNDPVMKQLRNDIGQGRRLLLTTDAGGNVSTGWTSPSDLVAALSRSAPDQ